MLNTVHGKKEKILKSPCLRDSNDERGSLVSFLLAYNVPVFRIHINLNTDPDTGIYRSADPDQSGSGSGFAL